MKPCVECDAPSSSSHCDEHRPKDSRPKPRRGPGVTYVYVRFTPRTGRTVANVEVTPAVLSRSLDELVAKLRARLDASASVRVLTLGQHEGDYASDYRPTVWALVTEAP